MVRTPQHLTTVNIDTYDGFLEALLAANVDRRAAERMALAKFGRPGASIETPSEEELRAALEKKHEHEGDKLMLALGFEVVKFSHPSRTKQTPGIPDRKYYNRRRGVTFWWESKADAGAQRPDQRVFQEMAESCGEIYVLGNLEALKCWIADNGIATRDGELFEPTPIPSSAA